MAEKSAKPPRDNLLRSPDRPAPADFLDRYCEQGWRVEFHYWVSSNMVRKWIDEIGRDKVRAARREWLASRPSPIGGAGRRHHDRELLPGRIRPWRNCPPDFREVYLRIGWEGITEHYRAGWPRICRWIDECGGDELRQARARYVAENGRTPLHPHR